MNSSFSKVGESLWNPDQYEKFKKQRDLPFHDLTDLVVQQNKGKPSFKSGVDLGCGTGELTSYFVETVKIPKMLGVDSSDTMLKKANPFQNDRLTFELKDIVGFLHDKEHIGKHDVVISNAALHWVEDHPSLFQTIYDFLPQDGQLGIQMPYNHFHISQQTIIELAKEEPYKTELKGFYRKPPLLTPEEYCGVLFDNGFRDQKVFLRVYEHVMPNGGEIAEWLKGSTMVEYEKRMSSSTFVNFYAEYKKRMMEKFPIKKGKNGVLFTFSRVFIWAMK